MQRFQSYKFRLNATSDQQLQMWRTAGCCRFVFNRALALQNQRLEEGRKLMGSEELSLLLAEWRRHPDCLWLAGAPFGTQQQALRNLVQAFARHASQLTRRPKFKERGRLDSFRCAATKDIKLDQTNSRILLPKLGWVRYRNSRAVMGSIMNVTVSASAGEWYISLLTLRSVAEFECEVCGFKENADLVGAMNVLRAGHARLACAETSLGLRGDGARTH